MLPKLQSCFGIPYEWRRGDTVATLSAPNASIGYHGGSEDGFIVQILGERSWSIWSPDVLSAPYRNFLCGDPAEPPPDARSNSAPLLSVTLTPGDALYVPALFPHEGITVNKSLSLAFAWGGLSAYKIFLDLFEERHGSRNTPLASHEAAGLCMLLDDPPSEADVGAYLCGELARIFRVVRADLRPDEAQVRAYVNLLLQSW